MIKINEKINADVNQKTFSAMFTVETERKKRVIIFCRVEVF